MNAARIAPWAIPRPKASTTSTPNTAAAIAARLIDPRQVGGCDIRSSRCLREICLASSRVRGRPVRPARSIVPAGVPRCLRVRLRLVWAIYERRYRTAFRLCLRHGAQDVLEDVPLRVEAAQRHVPREAVESRARREADQLSLGHLGSRAYEFDDVAQRHGFVVMHVRRHLCPVAVVQVEAERAHARQAAAGLAQAGGDVLRNREVVGYEIHIEG